MTETLPPADPRYTRVARALHWIIAALIVAQLVGGFVMHKLPNSASFKVEAYQMHKSFGLIVLALSLARLAWRLTHRPPPLPAGMAAWEVWLARLTHIAFYGLMIGVPLAGWLMISASPYPSSFLFLFDIPKLPVIGDAAFWAETHEVMAKLTAGLLVLHVAGALKHRYKDGHDVIGRMWPVGDRKAAKPIGDLR